MGGSPIPKDPRIGPYFRKTVADSNTLVQEKALDSLIAYLRDADAHACSELHDGIPELLEHQDQNVRACSMELTSDLCRWIGKDSVKSILLLEIRNKMEKKLDAWLANVSGTRKPYCQTRSEQDKEPEQEAVYETVLAFLKNLEL